MTSLRSLGIALPLGIVAVAAAVVTAWLALRPQAISSAGSSAFDTLLALVAGGLVFTVGLVCTRRQSESRFGVLLVLAGLVWLMIGWADPAGQIAIVFTFGLILRAASGPVVAHAALSYPDGQLGKQRESLTITLGYATSVGLIGLVPTLLFVPQAEGCYACPPNLLAVISAPNLAFGIEQLGLLLSVSWSVLVVALVGRQLVLASAATRLVRAPVLVPAAVFVALSGIGALLSLNRHVSDNQVSLWLWRCQAVALLVLVLGVISRWVRGRRMRARVARLVIDVARSPRPGSLRDLLAQAVGDHDLALAYPLADGRWVDPNGRPVVPAPRPGRIATTLLRNGTAVAMLEHRRGLEDDRARMDEVVRAARFGLESERLQAEARASLEDLRASRMRVVEANDRERQHLERDLHDGAQQRLVSLAIGLRLLRSRLPTRSVDPTAAGILDGVETELAAAIDQVRALAHGLYPAVLADEGLAAGVEALVESAEIPIVVKAMPAARFEASAERAAYLLIAETIRNGSLHRAQVSAKHFGDRLLVIVLAEGGLPMPLPEIEDRIATMGGNLAIDAAPGDQVIIRAEIPCAS